MNRRSLLLLVAALAVASPALSQDDPRLQRLTQAFAALSQDQRRVVQEELETAGLYAGPRDGSESDALTAALLDAAGFLEENSVGRVTVPLDTDAQAQTYLAGLADRSYSAWLYGEGDEG